MKKIILLLVILITLTSCGIQEDEKITTDFLSGSYSKEFHELNLAGQELTQVPNFEKYLTGSYIENVWSIDLSNNNIKEVNGDLFKYFPNLKELNLSYNKIQKIKLEHNFLQDLKLHKNILIKADLNGLKMLNNINLGYNNFKSGKDIILPTDIQTLELQHNKLIDLIGISKLKNLTKLKVEFNQLQNKDLQELSGLDKLNFISIKENKLTEEAEKAFLKFNKKNKEKELN